MTTATTQADDTQETGSHDRRGAPKGNRNNMRHGLRGTGLPADCGLIESDVNEYRRNLEDAVTRARGNVGVTDAATISRAMRFEIKARLAARWLTKHSDTLSPTELLRFADAATNATVQRDRAVADLELDGRHLASLWALTGPENEPEAA